PLRGTVQSSAIGVRIGVMLAEMFELANIHLAHKGGYILVVFISRFSLCDADLTQTGRHQFHNTEFGDIASDLIQPLGSPRRYQPGQAAAGDAVFVLKQAGHAFRMEKAEWGLEYGTDFPIDR